MKGPVKASAIASVLGKELIGDDVGIAKPSPIVGKAQDVLMFARRFSETTCDILNTAVGSLVIAHPAYSGRLKIPHILSHNPRLDYALSVQAFFAPPQPEGIAATALIAPTAKLGKGVFIGGYAVIGDGVEIGDRSYVAHHVALARGVKIGRHCIIQPGTVIGERGLAFEFNEEKIPVAVPHLGSVRIGDFVEIGAQCAISAGTIADTMIDDHVKIDDHVHISHNCFIGKATMITGSVEICGSVTIGDHVWVGPNSSIINKVKIGSGAFIGIGSVVMKDVESDKTVAGNPARVFDSRNKS